MIEDKEWWKRACDINYHAIAFVDKDDKFIYVNTAWCRLCGWSSSQLVGKMRWQDITVDTDVGGDQKSTESVKDGYDSEYYIEKEYVTPTGSQRAVGICVFRYPPIGDQEGYIVFAEPLENRAHENLRKDYNELKRDMLLIEQQQENFNKVFDKLDESFKYQNSRVESLERAQVETRELLNRILLNQSGQTSVNVGNSTESVGGNKNINSSWVIVACIVSILSIAVILMGAKIFVSHDNTQLNIQPMEQRND